MVIEAFAKDLIKLIKFAIEHKPIKRISRRRVKGKYVNTSFTSPVSASGDLAKTLTYKLTDTSLSIYANDYIYELIYGKKPTSSAGGNDHNLESQIKKWMSDKGIKAEAGQSQDTLAHLITEKIRKFGSSIYLANHGQNSGLLNNIISQQMIQEYNRKFNVQLGEEFKEAFQNGN